MSPTIDRTILLQFDASAHFCLNGCAPLCVITPKSLSSSLNFITLPPISYVNSWILFHMCIITEQVSRLNSICQSCDHLNILLRSSHSISASSSSPTALHSFVSSANLIIFYKIPSSVSLILVRHQCQPFVLYLITSFESMWVPALWCHTLITFSSIVYEVLYQMPLQNIGKLWIYRLSIIYPLMNLLKNPSRF